MLTIDYKILETGSILNKIYCITNNKSYIIVKDHHNNIICFTYDLQACKDFIIAYLNKFGFDEYNLSFVRKTMSNRDLRLYELMKYKLVMLDGHICLYKDVEEKAKDYIIEGLDRQFPKCGLNKYYTICKK